MSTPDNIGRLDLFESLRKAIVASPARVVVNFETFRSGEHVPVVVTQYDALSGLEEP